MAKNMPEVNPKDSEQNAFVQDWLTAWNNAHPSPEEEENEAVEAAVEQIQGTYDYTDHMRRTAD